MLSPVSSTGAAWPWAWLGAQGRATSGQVPFHPAVVQAVLSYGPAAVPTVAHVLATSPDRYQVCEALYAAQKLAEAKVPGAEGLYAATTRLHETPDPLLQVYLAGLYRALPEPAAFGVMLTQFLRNAQKPPGWWQGWGVNPQEEVGGTVLQKLAEQATPRAPVRAWA